MRPVRLVLPKAYATPHAARIYYWCASLLIRMGHRVDLQMPSRVATPRGLRGPRNLAQALGELKTAFPTTTNRSRPLRLIVTPQEVPAGSYQVWANGWSIWLGRAADSTDRPNPLAAAAAATAAVAIVHHAGRRNPDQRYRFNLWNFDDALDAGPDVGPLHTPDLLLAGAGAVGTAFALALTGLEITGNVHIVDTECFSKRNLIRYILAHPSDLNKSKARTAAGALRRTGLRATAEKADAGQVLHRKGPHRIVISATDTAESRRALATELPRMVLDGANAEDETRIEVARASFPPKGPCLACLYPVSSIPDEQTARMQRNLKLTFDEISQLRRTGKPLDEPLRRLILKRSRIRLPAQALGEGIDTAYNNHYCGSDVVTRKSPVEQSRPGRVFAPTMAGILLAIELVRLAHKETGPNWFTWDLSRPPNPSAARMRRANPACQVCSDPDYKAIWHQLHSTAKALPSASRQSVY